MVATSLDLVLNIFMNAPIQLHIPWLEVGRRERARLGRNHDAGQPYRFLDVDIDISRYWSSLSQTSNRWWSADTRVSSAYMKMIIHIPLKCIQLSWLQPSDIDVYTANKYGDNTPPWRTPHSILKLWEKYVLHFTHACINDRNQCAEA